MIGQSNLFGPTTCEASSSATFSPASEDGATRSDSLAGPMTASAGRFRVPANDSRARLEAERLRLIGGPSSGASLLQRALMCSLANKLPLPEFGSMRSALTWKPWVTKSGRLFCRLSLSVQTMRALGFTLLATPTETANQACPSMRKWPGCRDINVSAETWGERMGYPASWLRVLDLAMPSCPSVLAFSSKPTVKLEDSDAATDQPVGDVRVLLPVEQPAPE